MSTLPTNPSPVPAPAPNSPAAPRGSRWPGLIVAAALFVLTLIAFWPASHHPFTVYDDNYYVTGNPAVQGGLTPDGITYAFTESIMLLWTPVTVLSLMLDTELFGVSARAYHTVNVLLHCANAVLVFLVLRQATRSFARDPSAPAPATRPWRDANLWRCAMVAAVFAVHPLRVESVAWVAERKDVLALFFGMLAIWCYVRFVQAGGWWRYTLSLVWLALSLMSKPLFLTLPALLLLLDFWPLGRTDALFDRTRPLRSRLRLSARLVLEKLPMLAMGVALFETVKHISARDSYGLEFVPSDKHLLYANAVIAYLRYAVKMVRFDRLAFFYPMPSSIPTTHVVLGALLLAGVTIAVVVAALRHGRQYRPLALGWLWFMGTMFPMSGIFTEIGDFSMADRYTYLPCIGLLIMVFWSVPDWVFSGDVSSDADKKGAEADETSRRGGVALLCGYVAQCFGPLSPVRRGEGRVRGDEANYATRLIAPHPSPFPRVRGRGGKTASRHNQAILPRRGASRLRRLPLTPWATMIACAGVIATLFFFTRKQLAYWEDDIAMCRHALAVTENNVPARVNLAYSVAKKEENWPLAENLLFEASRIDPTAIAVWNGLGEIYRTQKRYDEAIAAYQKAETLQQYEPTAHRNLGRVYALLNRDDDAIREYKLALRNDPDRAETHEALSKLYARQGRPELASKAPPQTMSSAQAIDIMVSRGVDLADRGDLPGAIALYRQALAQAPLNADAHLNLGGALLQTGQFEESVRESKAVLQSRPDSPEALYNAGQAELKLGRRQEAIEHFRRVLTITPDDADAQKALRRALQQARQ